MQGPSSIAQSPMMNGLTKSSDSKIDASNGTVGDFEMQV